ncbi:hypothetical protein HDU96_005173 [Phlyctochytrium bullatum]|nr:hypothetical protein HDU96_005173 [Phlyctochytrium bullatum]
MSNWLNSLASGVVKAVSEVESRIDRALDIQTSSPSSRPNSTARPQNESSATFFDTGIGFSFTSDPPSQSSSTEYLSANQSTVGSLSSIAGKDSVVGQGLASGLSSLRSLSSSITSTLQAATISTGAAAAPAAQSSTPSSSLPKSTSDSDFFTSMLGGLSANPSSPASSAKPEVLSPESRSASVRSELLNSILGPPMPAPTSGGTTTGIGSPALGVSAQSAEKSRKSLSERLNVLVNSAPAATVPKGSARQSSASVEETDAKVPTNVKESDVKQEVQRSATEQDEPVSTTALPVYVGTEFVAAETEAPAEIKSEALDEIEVTKESKPESQAQPAEEVIPETQTEPEAQVSSAVAQEAIADVPKDTVPGVSENVSQTPVASDVLSMDSVDDPLIKSSASAEDIAAEEKPAEVAPVDATVESTMLSSNDVEIINPVQDTVQSSNSQSDSADQAAQVQSVKDILDDVVSKVLEAPNVEASSDEILTPTLSAEPTERASELRETEGPKEQSQPHSSPDQNVAAEGCEPEKVEAMAGDEATSTMAASSATSDSSAMQNPEAQLAPSTAVPTTSGQAQELQKELNHIKKVMEERERQLLAAITENASINETANILRSQLEQLEKVKSDENSRLEAVTAEFTKRLGVAELHSKELAKERDALRQQLQTAQGSLQGNTAMLMKQITERDEKIKDLLLEGERLSKNEFKTSGILKKLRAKEAEMEKEIKEFTKKLEANAVEIAELKDKVAKLSESEKRLNENLKLVNELNEKQAKQIVNLENQVAQSNVDKAQITTLLERSRAEVQEARKLQAEAVTAAQSDALAKETSANLALELQSSQDRSDAAKASAALQAERSVIAGLERNVAELSAKLEIMKTSHVRAIDEAKEKFQDMLKSRLEEEKRQWEEQNKARNSEFLKREAEKPRLSLDARLMIERIHAAMKHYQAQVGVLQGQLKMVTKTRDDLAEELLRASTEAQEHKALKTKAEELEKEKAEINRKFLTALELLGEKTEQYDELKSDLEDMKVSYRNQMSALMQEIDSLKGKNSSQLAGKE